MKSVNENKLQFVFTEDAFRVDTPDLEVREKDRELKAAFLKNRYKALFALAFEKEAEGESQSLSFLRFLSGRFFKDLISLPELEVARSQVSMELFDESVDEIIRAVPYGIGTENIGRAWIALMYSRLLDVYRRDIEDYDGTVQLYFTEKSQDIRVPERIFFHLVESREE